MSAILEHFKPPPLASDPPAKTRYWPAPPTGSSGGILQRPKPSGSTISASSSNIQLSTCPSPSLSSRVSFAPLPDLAPRKRRNSITLGVAARSATLRRMKETRASGTGEVGPRQPSATTGRRNVTYAYQGYQAGQPRARAARRDYKDEDVVDLGEVAIDAGKKLWRAINKKKSRKTGTASDSGRPHVEDPHSVGGPTVGATGHNTEREILVRGFAVPEEDEEEDDDDDEEEDEAEEAQHRTEDYVAGIQAMHISDSNGLPCDPSTASPEAKPSEVIEASHIHATRLSPPPFSPRSESSDLGTSDSSSPSGVSTPSPEQDTTPIPPVETGKDSLF